MTAREVTSEQFKVRELSARIGGDPLLVQASSGNTSVKFGDELWIKASGKWLLHAEAEDFLVPVRLSRARRCLRENAAIPETQTDVPERACASIETAMHAVLPQKIVVHVHSVNAIAWAVREDGARQLSSRLSGLRWQWIPYSPSGLALAKKIEQALADGPETDVFILGNHGLVICGDSCRSAERLLAEVEERLTVTPRPAPEPHFGSLQRALGGSSWSLPPCLEVHALATDPVCRRILSGGVLYPCQSIFLSRSAERLFDLFEDQGVLCSSHMTLAEQETLIGLAHVVRRIDASAPLRYLTPSEALALSNGEAESYRRAADKNCGSVLMMPNHS